MREHRKDFRSQKKMNVWIYRDQMLMGLARTVNFSSKGMFIKTDALRFPKSSELEVVFNDEHAEQRHCLVAKVVHRSMKGIGIEFDYTSQCKLKEFGGELQKSNMEFAS